MTISSPSSLTIDPKQWIWEQKYRPNNVEEVIIPDKIKDLLLNFAAEGHIPSFLFNSPSPGTGKTTTALALANAIGCTSPLFINASLDTSIDAIRSKVLQYSTTVSVVSTAKQKVVILDECERLSTAAQESLKGILESVSKNCSFILTTNSIQKIVAPLVSRCRRVDFIWDKETSNDLKVKMCHRVVEILKLEEIPFEPKAVMAVVNRFYPDNRSMLGTLQAYAQQNGKIDLGVVNSLGGEQFDTIIKILKARDFKLMTQWVMDNVDTIGPDFYGRFFRFVYPDVRVRGDLQPKISPESVPTMVVLLGEEQKFHSGTPDPFIHLVRVLTIMMTDQDIKFV